MHRWNPMWIVVLALSLVSVVFAEDKNDPETIDPAKVDADYAVQGEYKADKLGAHVIALGGGQFDVVMYPGGLPGDGWPTDAKNKQPERLRGKGTAGAIAGDGWSAKIAGGKMMVTGKVSATLERVVRESSTLGAKAPTGAIVLFDGTEASAKKNWNKGTIILDNLLLSDDETKQKFNDHTLHLEFRLSYRPFARGQGRSNSGVYMQSRYELQVLDSFGLEGKDNECGGIYSIAEPSINMCYPPLQWQTYDIEFTAAKWEGDKKVKNGYVKILHNGVLIHDHELTHGTPGKNKELPGPDGLYIQGHGNRVVYRNVWVVPKN